jgi:uncharacterized protein (DUF1015 family)
MCPIFGIYPDSENAVQDAIEAGIKDATPVEVVDDAGVVHRMWGATHMRAISEGTRLMGPHPIFIADGHHRYETALNYRRALIQEQGPLPDDHAANYVLMCCVSMSDQGMIVLPTHRLFRGVPALDSAELASRLGESFDCEVIAEGAEAAPQVWEQVEFEDRQSTLGLFTAKDKKWTLARLTDAGAQRMASLSDHSEDWNSLGVSLLHTLIVENLLGLHELPSPLYVRKIEEVVSSLNTGDAAGRDSTGQQGTGEPFQFAAIVMPASVSDVEAISLNRERMPAKSTFFYPKMLSGLVFNPLK